MVGFIGGLVVASLASVGTWYTIKHLDKTYENGYNDGYEAGLIDGKNSREMTDKEKKLLEEQIAFEEKRMEGLSNILEYQGDVK